MKAIVNTRWITKVEAVIGVLAAFCMLVALPVGFFVWLISEGFLSLVRRMFRGFSAKPKG